MPIWSGKRNWCSKFLRGSLSIGKVRRGSGADIMLIFCHELISFFPIFAFCCQSMVCVAIGFSPRYDVKFGFAVAIAGST